MAPAAPDPFKMPMATREPIMRRGMDQPKALNAEETGGKLLMAAMALLLSSRMFLTIPAMWPAPTTATSRLPGEFLIFSARYISRSSISTFFSSGMASPSSDISSDRTSFFFNSCSFSSVISVLSKRLARRVARR